MDKIIKIGVSGSTGAMGVLLVDEIKKHQDLKYVGSIDYDGSYSINFSDVPDVIIDFSRPEALETILEYARSNNTALLICTTGFSNDQINNIKSFGENGKVLLSSNTSLGINAMRKALSVLGDLLKDFDIELVESHHNKKVDAPSGTAKTLRDDVEHFSEKENLPIHSLRMGAITGEHSVLFVSNGEKIEIKHTALNKTLFSSGAVNLARKLVKKENGFYDTMDVI